jgi:Ion channel
LEDEIMANQQCISLKIQPTRSVLKEIVENRKIIIGVSACIFVYAGLSTIIFHATEGIQQIDGHERINNWLDSFYFTMINLTTVGFGDIVPTTQWGKWLAIANSLIGVAAFGFLIACLTAALQPSDFKGEGTINKGGDADTESPLRAAMPETPEQTAVMFWSSLTALIEQSPRERPIYITRATVEGRKPDVVVEVHVLVHRPPEVA